MSCGAPEAKLPRLDEPEAGDRPPAKAKDVCGSAHAPAVAGATAVAKGLPGAAAAVVAVAKGLPGAVAAVAAAAAAVAGQPPPETQRALEALDACQHQLEALSERASEEILQVERKYSELRRPHFERRNRLIEGIPGFWVTAFLNHPQLSALIDDNDEEAFNYMMRLEVEEFEDIKSGYRIKFNFSENPYFDNNLIIKEFHLGTGGKPVSQSTPIKWKKGMDLTALSKGVDEKGRKRGHRSFFAWFTEHRNPTTDEIAEAIPRRSDDDDVEEIDDGEEEEEEEVEEVEEEGVEVEGEDEGAKEGGDG
uniref:protein SET-like n=1 Tax=Pristiophorus japonicus TaxID=55135 RepID=UPI00398E88CB